MSFDVDMDEFVELQKENRSLREQLETFREALEFLRDCHDDHDPRCASFFESLCGSGLEA